MSRASNSNLPCSSEAPVNVIPDKACTVGKPESTLDALSPASTTARPGAGVLMTEVYTNRLC